jgi:predicted phosphodiesterase
MKVERVVFAGDWHGNTVWALQAIRHARDSGAQAIVHTGDYGYRFTRPFLEAVEAMLRLTGLRLYFVDGNHEDFDRLHAFPVAKDGTRPVTERVRHLPRGYAWTWSGVRFLACGGAVSMDQRRRIAHLSWWPQEALTELDVRACRRRGRADVVVSHDCPDRVHLPLDDSGRWPEPMLTAAAQHRETLRYAITRARPRVIVHGHYHVAHDTAADLGWGPVRVVGLDRDTTTLAANTWVVDLDLLRRPADDPDGVPHLVAFGPPHSV